jgi:uncharacterized membrane protein required for colicin V production
MPLGFTWLDITIAIFLLLSLLQGIRAGLIRSVFTIAGIAVGLTVAIKYYAVIGGIILQYVDLPQLIADSLAFIALFSLLSATVHLVGSLVALITRFSLIKLLDKLGGSATGLAIGAALAGVTLILFTAFPIFDGFQNHVDQSFLAPPIVETTEMLYEELSDALPLDLPVLKVHSEDLNSYFSTISTYGEHDSVDFRALDGATCFVCGSPVQFLGFVENGKGSISPKFICGNCGRTSDGCQTYEGYHEMYDQCPVELGNQGYRLDCGIWTNNSYHRPGGPCPVCGTE